MNVNGKYAVDQGTWQQIQELEAGQGTLSGLSEPEQEEVKEIEKKGSTASHQELQTLLALLQENKAKGQPTTGLGISQYG